MVVRLPTDTINETWPPDGYKLPMVNPTVERAALCMRCGKEFRGETCPGCAKMEARRTAFRRQRRRDAITLAVIVGIPIISLLSLVLVLARQNVKTERQIAAIQAACR